MARGAASAALVLIGLVAAASPVWSQEEHSQAAAVEADAAVEHDDEGAAVEENADAGGPHEAPVIIPHAGTADAVDAVQSKTVTDDNAADSGNATAAADATAAGPWSNGLAGFDGVMVINLDSRQDRLDELTPLLEKLGLESKYVRIPGVVAEGSGPGQMEDAITQAHLNCLLHAKEQGWENYVVLEDDFGLITAEGKDPMSKEEIDEAVNGAMNNLDGMPGGWDMLFIAGNMRKATEVEGKPHIQLVEEAVAASGYVINKQAYGRFENAWTSHTQGIAVDLLWKPIVKESHVFVVNPKFGRQRVSESEFRPGLGPKDWGDNSRASQLVQDGINEDNGQIDSTTPDIYSSPVGSGQSQSGAKGAGDDSTGKSPDSNFETCVEACHHCETRGCDVMAYEMVAGVSTYGTPDRCYYAECNSANYNSAGADSATGVTNGYCWACNWQQSETPGVVYSPCYPENTALYDNVGADGLPDNSVRCPDYVRSIPGVTQSPAPAALNMVQKYVSEDPADQVPASVLSQFTDALSKAHSNFKESIQSAMQPMM